MRWILLCCTAAAVATLAMPPVAAAAPDPPPGGTPDVTVEPTPGDTPGGGAEIAPVTIDPDVENPNLDDVDPNSLKELPPHGMGERPALPTVDRDMLSPRQHSAGRGGATLQLARIGEDTFLDLDLRYVISVDAWRIVPQLPLRLRIIDERPSSHGVIRKEDWDEASDWARLLAYVQYGTFRSPYFFRYGELNGVTIGHGSLVNRYFNTVDVDHYQGGIFAYLDGGFAGGEVMLDNVFDPEIFVGRAYVRPFSLFKQWPGPARLIKLGFTGGADFTAPLAVATANGSIFASPDWQPKVLADEVAGLFSVDLEVPVVSTPHFDLVPYTDVATVDGKGVGWHLGTYANIRFTPRTALRTRLEYRLQGRGYEPGYISPFYEIQRYSHLGGDPKLAQLRDGVIGKRHNGFYVESDLRVNDVFRFTVMYATRGGPRGQDLLGRLRLRDLGPVSLTLFYGRIGFGGHHNPLFAADHTVWGTSLKVNLTDWFFVTGALVNEWWLRHRANGAGYFETHANFSFGVGLQLQI